MPYRVATGDMRHRIQLQSSTSSSDSFGQPSRNWTTYQTCWAKIEGAGGAESAIDSQTQSLTYTTVTIRFNPAVLTDQQILWRNRTLAIKGLRDPDGRRTWLVLDCVDRQKPGETI